MNELVSVVVPVYKVEPYLERCIRSIIGQTYENLEIILVDDGSPDRCGEICDRFAQEDPRIKVYHKPNSGASDTRNYGVERAHGAYITFIASDHYISQDYIAYLLELLVNCDADISCCGIHETMEDMSLFNINAAIPKEWLFTGKEACAELLGKFYSNLVTIWGKLYKSDIVRQYPFPVGRRYEDEAIIGKYYYAAKRVVVGSRCLYAYYQNPNSFMHNQPKTSEEAIWAHKHRAEFFEEQHEKRLAEISWNFLLNYILRDSLENHGRYDHYLDGFERGKSLDIKTRVAIKLYKFSPYIYKICLKVYCGLHDAIQG